MATIYKPKGTQYWWGRVQRNGRERRETLRTASRSVAERRLREMVERLDAQAWGDKPRKTYAEGMASFVLEHLPRLKPSTQARYLVSARLLHRHFARMYLDQITSARLAEFEVDRRRKGAKSPTIRRDLLCLSSMFTHCEVDKEWCSINPVSPFLRRQRLRGGLKENPPRTRYLRHAEEADLLAAAEPDMAAQMAVAIDSGLRKGELWSLTWGQIQGGYREILIPAGQFKSDRERRVPLLPRSAYLLAKVPRHIRRDDEPDWVFCKINGERYGERRKAFLAAVHGAGLNDLVFHDLRRTCGCRLLQEHGLSMKKVADWLGHKSVVVTERSYAFLGVEDLHEAVGLPHNSRHRNAGLKKK